MIVLVSAVQVKNTHLVWVAIKELPHVIFTMITMEQNSVHMTMTMIKLILHVL